VRLARVFSSNAGRKSSSFFIQNALEVRKPKQRTRRKEKVNEFGEKERRMVVTWRCIVVEFFVNFGALIEGDRRGVFGVVGMERSFD
jgi:hypothetical protein